MKRHRALEPFSRDHNTGLIVARRLIEERPDAAAEFLECWSQELRDHFDKEERLLVGMAKKGLWSQLLTEHEAVRQLASELPETGRELGVLLHDHIRWEERTLFPEIEQSATQAQLDALRAEAEKMERKRWEHDPKRKVLVLRRWEAGN